MPAKLHEILAVEGDKEGIFKKVLAESIHVFKEKAALFFERHKILESFIEEENVEAAEEHHAMTTTVPERLDWTAKFIIDYLDIVLQKEKTNQIAKADLIISGVTIAKDMPATYLLGLETKFKKIREMFDVIPTLAAGGEWAKDETKGEGIYKAVHPEKKFKTAKTFVHKTLYEATKEHPAQIKEWEETKNVGQYVTNFWCSMLSSADKANMLARIDKVIQGCKKARQRANCEVVIASKIGKELMNYIMNP